jgi:heme A synthase
VTRFQKLVGATLATTLGLVIVGVIVRATGSGLGCPDWPFCYGQLVPPLGDFKAWAEWIHRFIAAVIGILVLGVAALAVLDHRDRPSLVLPSIGAVALVGFQAWLGEETVRLGNSGPSVTAHLATALAVVGLLAFLLVRGGYPARMSGRGASQRFTLLAAFTAVAAYALLLFGSNVTSLDAALIYPDWPLMGGAIVPPFAEMPPATQVLAVTNALHRYVAVIVGVLLAATWLAAWRGHRSDRTLFRLVSIAAVLYPLQALIGAFQVWTQLAPWTQTLHVALAAFIWVAAVAAVFVSYYGARVRISQAARIAGSGSGLGSGSGASGGSRHPDVASVNDAHPAVMSSGLQSGAPDVAASASSPAAVSTALLEASARAFAACPAPGSARIRTPPRPQCRASTSRTRAPRRCGPTSRSRSRASSSSCSSRPSRRWSSRRVTCPG